MGARMSPSSIIAISSNIRLTFPSLTRTSIWNAQPSEYLMARPPPYVLPETDTPEAIPSLAEGVGEVDVDTEVGGGLGLNENIEMSGPSGSGETPHGFGTDSSLKYSHEDTRPEKIKEKMKDLHEGMQDTLRRLDHLDAKLKNGVGKRQKKADSNSARRNEELMNALNNMMNDANDNGSK